MVAYGACRRSPGRQPHAGSKNHERQILEAQAILARHIAGEHASAEETIAKLMQLLGDLNQRSSDNRDFMSTRPR
jgi:hypothetical protein